MRARRVGWLCGTLVAIAATAAAQAPTTLPEVVVSQLDGASITTEAFAPTGPWLLVIVDRPCPACPPLLDAVDAATSPRQGARMVVVWQRGSAAEVAAQVPRVGGLATARHVLDEEARCSAALRLSGAPVVLGMRDRRVVWRHAGTMPAAQLAPLIAGWVRTP